MGQNNHMCHQAEGGNTSTPTKATRQHAKVTCEGCCGERMRKDRKRLEGLKIEDTRKEVQGRQQMLPLRQPGSTPSMKQGTEEEGDGDGNLVVGCVSVDKQWWNSAKTVDWTYWNLLAAQAALKSVSSNCKMTLTIGGTANQTEMFVFRIVHGACCRHRHQIWLSPELSPEHSISQEQQMLSYHLQQSFRFN
ncbi:hypothetical protein H4582DRAFT_2052651 [Lactarius indigo]|nr:hypothetical protein H4582DRAFT_2052651 [Lactarius indigo]